MHWSFYVLIRLLLWLAAVAVAIFPTVASIPDTADIHGWGFTPDGLSIFNRLGLFRDLFFVIIPAAALAISTLIDYLCMCREEMSGTAFGLSLMGLLANIAALCAGFVGFSNIPRDHEMMIGRALTTYSWLIMCSLLAGLVTEVAVSWSHGRIQLNESHAEQN